MQTPSSVFDQITQREHERVVYGYDPATGLKAIIAIHNTTLGPALGGTRLWEYVHDEAALTDVLRLSEGMTYKASIAGLDLGGGKAVLIGDVNKVKTEAYFKSYGRFVNSLQGAYVTAPDVNTTMHDMEWVAQETAHVVGLPTTRSGSGDSSIMTAYGVYMGIKAAAKKVYGTDSLHGKRIGVEGVGKVGSHLIPHLCQEGAQVCVTDIVQERLVAVAQQHTVQAVLPEVFYDEAIDIYAPCAMGATLNDTTIPRLRCAIIAGGANNQLADEQRHGPMLLEKGIVYAPDFLVNAGGVINAHAEMDTYNRDVAYQHTERIYTICLEVLNRSTQERLPPQTVAMQMAQQRIKDVGTKQHRS
ncbi:MAG: Glu/Leu/Phe/Val dehydrogenase dimerization domain-containing protein [Roseivirga sp.]